jgi:hypothetical protein
MRKDKCSFKSVIFVSGLVVKFDKGNHHFFNYAWVYCVKSSSMVVGVLLFRNDFSHTSNHIKYLSFGQIFIVVFFQPSLDFADGNSCNCLIPLSRFLENISIKRLQLLLRIHFYPLRNLSSLSHNPTIQYKNPLTPSIIKAQSISRPITP